VTDLVAEATVELYAAEPEEFTARRQRLVASARTAGDKEAAKRIGELRKPTKAAWLLNRLVRAQPEVPVQLAMVADGLRSASREGDGARLRELSGARSALVDEFTSRALSGVADPASGLREDIAGTLEAAIADPAVAADLAAGTLTRPVRYAGFGTGDFGTGDFGAGDFGAGDFGAGDFGAGAATGSGSAGTGSAGTDSAGTDSAGAGSAGAGSAGTDSAGTDSAGAGSAGAGSAGTGEPVAPVAVAPTGAPPGQAPRTARPATDRTPASGNPAPTPDAASETVALRVTAERNRQIQQLRDAERTLANAATLAESAEENETRLEDLVRDLEQRLVAAREELADARLRSRRAEVAERKARQALDRLRPPDKGHP
jgi:hypothetical protein